MGSAIEASVYDRTTCQLGEGPVWWQGVLYWVDIVGQTVYALPDGEEQARSFPTGGSVGALVPWEADALLLARGNGFARLDLPSGQLTPLCAPEAHLAGNRMNDGKCDPLGRFIVGSMDLSARPGAGAVYRLDHDLRWEKVQEPMTIPNGLAWDRSGKTLYHIDTPTRQVRAYAYELQGGTWGDSGVVIEIPEGQGFPDGMTMDAEGNLWIALWDGWAVECWSPQTGQKLARIDLPVARPTCPVFGGDRWDRMFITSASAWLSDEERTAQPLAGKVFVAEPGVRGLPPQPFAGVWDHNGARSGT